MSNNEPAPSGVSLFFFSLYSISCWELGNMIGKTLYAVLNGQ